MKIFEICFFKKDRSERFVASICSNGEQEAMKKAMDERQVMIRRPDWKEFVEVTAEFTHFIEDNVWKNLHNINQVVCEEGSY